MKLQFIKRVGKTIEQGRVTLPKECEHFITATEYCPVGDSIAIAFFLISGVQIQGRLYQSVNNTTTYYQFYIPNSTEREVFRDEVKSEKKIRFDFYPNLKTLAVSPMVI